MREPNVQAGDSASVMGSGELVYVVVLNWNGWRDTIECLESLLRSERVTFKTIVCDNASSDGSFERITDWCEGRISVLPDDPRFSELVVPNIPKPINYAIVEPGGALPGGVDLFLIQTGANLGFAGGNNVGIRLALRDPACRFIWLLNNDVVVKSDALLRLVERASLDKAGDCCGSTLLFYYAPERVQALGGVRYNRWIGIGAQIGLGSAFGKEVDTSYVERRMSYVAGASMLLSRRLLEAVGLLSEEYFLYYEEIDLAVRASRKFRLCYASKSIVYPKEGRSIGTSSLGAPSRLSTHLFYYNKISFVRKFFPLLLPSTLLFVGWDVVKQLLRGNLTTAVVIMNAAFLRRRFAGLPQR
jgi:GT2 family glycosyltransferase